MKNFVRNKVTPKLATTCNQRSEIIRFLGNVLASPITLYDTKDIIKELIAYIIMKAPNTAEEDALIGLTFQLGFDMFGLNTKHSFLGGLLLIETVIDGSSKDAKVTGNIYRGSVSRMLEIGSRLLNHLEPEFIAWNQSDTCNFSELTLS